MGKDSEHTAGSGWAVRLWGGLAATKPRLDEADTRQAERILVTEGVLVTGMATLQGGIFLSAFALALGASNYEIGLLTTIVFSSQLMQLPGLALVNRVRRRRLLTVIFAGVARLMWIPILALPLLFTEHGVTFLLLWIVLSSMIGAMAGPPWNSLVRDAVPVNRLGRMFSRRLSWGTGLALVLTLLGGYFVDHWKAAFPSAGLLGYSLIFAVGLLLGLAGLVALTRLPEPTMENSATETWKEILLQPLLDTNFRPLITFIAGWTFALNMAAPFFVIYMLQRIGLSVFMITVLTVTSQVSNLIFLRVWGKLVERFSNKSVLSVSCPLFLATVLAWCFTTMPERYFLTIPLLFTIQFVGGMASAGVTIGVTNLAFKLCPEGKAHSFLTVFGLSAAIAGAAAPLAGGIIADLFAQRNLSLPVNWSGPNGAISVYVLNFKAHDFLFFFTFLVGMFSLRWLRRIKEQGEVTEQVVLASLRHEIALPLRTYGSVEGVRRLSFLPFAILLKTLDRITKRTREHH